MLFKFYKLLGQTGSLWDNLPDYKPGTESIEGWDDLPPGDAFLEMPFVPYVEPARPLQPLAATSLDSCLVSRIAAGPARRGQRDPKINWDVEPHKSRMKNAISQWNAQAVHAGPSRHGKKTKVWTGLNGVKHTMKSYCQDVAFVPRATFSRRLNSDVINRGRPALFNESETKGSLLTMLHYPESILCARCYLITIVTVLSYCPRCLRAREAQQWQGRSPNHQWDSRPVHLMHHEC